MSWWFREELQWSTSNHEHMCFKNVSRLLWACNKLSDWGRWIELYSWENREKTSCKILIANHRDEHMRKHVPLNKVSIAELVNSPKNTEWSPPSNASIPRFKQGNQELPAAFKFLLRAKKWSEMNEYVFNWEVTTTLSSSSSNVSENEITGEISEEKKQLERKKWVNNNWFVRD